MSNSLYTLTTPVGVILKILVPLSVKYKLLFESIAIQYALIPVANVLTVPSVCILRTALFSGSPTYKLPLESISILYGRLNLASEPTPSVNPEYTKLNPHTSPPPANVFVAYTSGPPGTHDAAGPIIVS
jgi:hypothetical protein